MSNITELDKKYIANTYSRFPVEIDYGKGSVAYTADEKKYIDMGSGIGVNIFGYADKEWEDAVGCQMKKLQHSSNLYYTEPDVLLAQMLCEKTGMKKVFFSNSGAEANECAIKAARKYSQDKKGQEYYNIITLKNSFHGRTLTTLAATGQDVFHKLFTPLTDGFYYAEANNLDSVKTIMSEHKTAAIMIECIQGEGGVNVLSKEFVRGLSDIAEKEDVLLIIDEVQTGNGRTGKLYSYMNYGIKPDIVTTAKGLGGGLPIGACMLGDKAENVLKVGEHGSTFGGNPICCAGALSILKRLDDTLFKEVSEKSKFIFDSLKGSKGIEDVVGMGLIIGIKTEKNASEVAMKCLENGVLCLTAKDKLRLLPALNISMENLKEAIAIIKKSCE